MMNNKSCLRNGFKLVCANTSKGRRYIKCERHALQRKSMAISTSTKSSRPTHLEECCNFSLCIKHDEEHNRFFLRKNGGCCLSHNGHTSIPFEKRITGANDLPDHDLGKIGKFIRLVCLNFCFSTIRIIFFSFFHILII